MSSYKIPFESLTGNAYEIRIYPTAEGYDADNAVLLVGGAEPISTDDEGGTDILLPVRSSTGYINIVTDDYGLQAQLMPTTADGMRVTLVRYPRTDETDQNVRVAWEGYIRPETFTQEWTAGPWEIQLPIISRLGMIMDDYLSDGNTGLLTIGAWLARLCGDVYKYVLIPNDELATQGTMDWGTDTLPTPTVLQLAVSEELFKTPIQLPDRENPNNTTSGLWEPGTNKDIATSLCTALRWVLREDGDTLVCDDPGTTASAYLRYTVAQLTTEAPAYSDMEPMQSVTIEDLGEEWPDTRLGGDDGSKEVLLPYGKVTLSGAADGFDVQMINAADEDWQKTAGIPYVNGAPASFNRPDTVPFTLYGDSSCTIKSQKVLDNPELESFHYFSKRWDFSTGFFPAGEPDSPEHAGTSLIYKNCFPYVIQGLGTNEEGAKTAGAHFGGGEVSAIHYFYERSESYVHYRLNSIILGKLTTTDSQLRPGVRIKTTLAQLLPYSSRQRGYISLCLSGTVFRGLAYNNIDMSTPCDGDGIYGIKVSIKMGDLYLYKDSWGTHQCSLTPNEAPFEILWTKENDNQFREYIRLGMTDGYPMALDTPVVITIYTPTDEPRPSGRNLANGCYYLRIDNFQVTATEQEEDDDYDFSETLVEEPNSGISMSSRIGHNKLEEYTISTSLGGPDNPGALIAVIPVTITGASMSMMQARKVGLLEGANDGARYLCSRTFDWLKLQGINRRHCLKIPLLTERPWSIPLVGRINAEDGTYFPAARSTNWRDDKTTLTLIELKYE